MHIRGDMAESFTQGPPSSEKTSAGELASDRVSIFLRPAGDLEQKARKTPFVATKIDASGGVILIQPEQHLRIEGDTLTSSLEKGEHYLSGTPATVTQGNTHMMAQNMVLHTDPNNQLLRVEVPCPGNAYTLLAEDLNGRPLSQPRPALVRWDQRMVFVPADREALAMAAPDTIPQGEDDPIQDRLTLTGNVAFDSMDNLTWPVAPGSLPADQGPGDHMRCQKLKLALAVAPQNKPAASRPAASQADSSSALLGRRLVQTVHATTDVRLSMQVDDEAGYLQRRMLVRSQDIQTNRRTGEMVASGDGVMVVEDYRPPLVPSAQRQVAQIDRDPLMPQQTERPSQMIFNWSRQMRLSRPDGKAWVAQLDNPDAANPGPGAVQFRWASGKRIVAQETLHIRPDLPMGAGQLSELDCGYLTARFTNAPKPTTTAPSTPTMDDLHLDLDRLEAVHAVRLKNTSASTLECYGGRLNFDGDTDTILVTGDEKGSDATNAYVFYQDSKQVLSPTPYPRFKIVRTKAGVDIQFGEKPRSGG